MDYDKFDKEDLKYEWKISGNGINKTVSAPNPAQCYFILGTIKLKQNNH